MEEIFLWILFIIGGICFELLIYLILELVFNGFDKTQKFLNEKMKGDNQNEKNK